MKKLELELKKKLLIVEAEFMSLGNGKEIHCENNVLENYLLTEDVRSHKLICKGSELTNEYCDILSVKFNFGTNMYPDVKFLDHVHDFYSLSSSFESFISSIEAQGYYWGENPVSLVRAETYRSMGDDFKADGIQRAWQEAELKTFNPEKTLIFEIL